MTRPLVLLALIAAPLGGQTIPLREGLTFTYVHRNFHRDRDDEIRVWVVRQSEDESVWNAVWVNDPCPGVEDHMSRREQLGARQLDFARGGTADQVLPERRSHTLYLLSRRIWRLLHEGEPADMIVQVVTIPEPRRGADGKPLHCQWEPTTSQLVQGLVRRVGDTTATLMVDGRAVTVPLLQVRADFVDIMGGVHMSGDMWFVDDSLASWVTRIEMTRQDKRTFFMALGTVTTPGAGAAIERQLQESCRASVYGIYFPFNSAAVDSASAPTFQTVADMLRRHADWTLTIEGHTDSIGNPAANLKLSEQRATAVRQALVSRYGVVPARLAAAGRGMGGYVAPNNTLEGRARNRRVDLVRRCGGAGR